jgi:hypothetical protein
MRRDALARDQERVGHRIPPRPNRAIAAVGRKVEARLRSIVIGMQQRAAYDDNPSMLNSSLASPLPGTPARQAIFEFWRSCVPSPMSLSEITAPSASASVIVVPTRANEGAEELQVAVADPRLAARDVEPVGGGRTGHREVPVIVLSPVLVTWASDAATATTAF